MKPLAGLFKKMGYSDISLNVYSTSDRQTTKVG
jgi:hypothetical protein